MQSPGLLCYSFDFWSICNYVATGFLYRQSMISRSCDKVARSRNVTRVGDWTSCCQFSGADFVPLLLQLLATGGEPHAITRNGNTGSIAGATRRTRDSHDSATSCDSCGHRNCQETPGRSADLAQGPKTGRISEPEHSLPDPQFAQAAGDD